MFWGGGPSSLLDKVNGNAPYVILMLFYFLVVFCFWPTNLRFPPHYLNNWITISTVSQLTFSTNNGSFENEKSKIPTASWWWLRWWWRQLGPAGTLMICQETNIKIVNSFLCSNFLGIFFVDLLVYQLFVYVLFVWFFSYRFSIAGAPDCSCGAVVMPKDPGKDLCCDSGTCSVTTWPCQLLHGKDSTNATKNRENDENDWLNAGECDSSTKHSNTQSMFFLNWFCL